MDARKQSVEPFDLPTDVKQVGGLIARPDSRRRASGSLNFLPAVDACLRVIIHRPHANELGDGRSTRDYRSTEPRDVSPRSALL